MKFSIFILVAFLAISCEKEVTLELEEHNPKLVVNCLFNPDTNFRVFVSQTNQVNSNTPVLINSALVYLQKDGVLLDVLSYESDGWYVSNYSPVYGTKYRIDVIYESDSVYAESSIPEAIDTFSGTYKLISDQSQNSTQPSYEIEYVYNFSDGQEANFYHIMEGNILQSPENYSHITNPSILADSEIKYNPRSLFFSDLYFNGEETTISANIVHLGGLGGVPGAFNGVIKSLSSEYYKFIKSWVRHRFNQNTETNIDDPLTLIFQGEPSELYTNVVGGYGIFAGYNKTSADFTYIP